MVERLEALRLFIPGIVAHERNAAPLKFRHGWMNCRAQEKASPARHRLHAFERDKPEASKKSLEAMQQTNTDALRMAKMTQNMADEVSASTLTALDHSAQAKGNLEAQQANTQVQAAGVMAMAQGNNLLANISASQALRYQKELQDEAIARANMQQSIDNLMAATANIDLRPIPR